jgi:hypothetical protein
LVDLNVSMTRPPRPLLNVTDSVYLARYRIFLN